MKRTLRARRLALILSVLSLVGLLSQCSDDTTEPAAVGSIAKAKDSGDNQVWLKGEMLPAPFVVVVKTIDGAPAEGTSVLFEVIEGGGTIAPSAGVGSDGHASATLTLGPQAGTNRVRVSVAEDPSQSVEFQAEGGDFYCPEADTIQRVSYGTAGHLLLATKRSSIYPGLNAGVVAINPFNQPSISGFAELPWILSTPPVVRDCAFSPRGDYYVSQNVFGAERIVKVLPTGGSDPEAPIVIVDDQSEIDMNPNGLLVGCDKDGPFIIGCLDTLQRFDIPCAGSVNNDAVAVDPRRQWQDPFGEDIYFICTQDRKLHRLPMDGVEVEPSGLTDVADLTLAEAEWARGMVCDDDGSVYILVDTDSSHVDPTKTLLQVKPDGTKTLYFDFFDRVPFGGSLAQAGMQRDLAIDRRFGFVYTLDTLNRDLIVYQLSQGPGQNIIEIFTEAAADSVTKSQLATSTSVTERIGLGVIP